MTLDEYQKEAIRTSREPDLAVHTLGLCGEAGEFADLIKKHLGHSHALDRDKAVKELGDVLWYVAALATDLGFSLESVAGMNVAKLRERYPAGFTVDASKHD